MQREIAIVEGPGATASSAEWARIPKTGKTLEGLYRSQLFALIRSRQIKSAAVKPSGAIRTGMRLVHVPSLRAWIESHVDNGTEG